MARKKTKTEEVETEEETKPVKKTSKKAKKLQITYEPRFSASEKKTVILRDAVQVAVEYKPKIEGLPPVITLSVGEKMEVTEAQFKALYELGYIDTPEDIEAREQERLKYNTQPGADPRTFKVAAKRSHLYEDNFILVE